MKYIIGAIVTLIVIFFMNVKKKTDNYNKMTLLYFPEWKSLYDSCPAHEKRLIARAFLLQTIHLAPTYGAISTNKAKALQLLSYKENPVEIVDNWINTGLPYVIDLFGENQLLDAQARMIGVFMFAALQSGNPERSLRIFYEKIGSSHLRV